jgi:hypothetical protein
MNDPLMEASAMRERAATIRRRAEMATHPAAKNALLSAAETYEQLAKAAEQAALKA